MGACKGNLVLSFQLPESESVSRSVVSDSLQPHGLLCPWDSLGKSIVMYAPRFSVVMEKRKDIPI